MRQLFCLIVVCWVGLSGCGQEKKAPSPDRIIARIQTASRGEPISPFLFGMFIEPLGNVDVGDLIDDGLWAELLDDRKFFYAVDLSDEQTPPNKRNNPNQWKPLDDPSAISMDSVAPFVGIHSPKIRTRQSKPQGIQQSGLALVVGKKYVGRIVLSGSPAVDVTLTLTWGEEASQRFSVKLGKLTEKYKTHLFTVECNGASEKARFEISGEGEGTFSVGAVSLMPEDNISGFRPDVIRLLRELNSSLYRWGGNMSSGYDWRDGIGDPDRRPTRYEYAWEAVESNDVGTAEMIKFAELINVDLALTVNAGFGDAFSAAQWVEYVNGSVGTPMGKLRAQHGHPAPYRLRLWCVGNESYGWWQLGHTDVKSYVIKHNLFAQKMKAVDPTIKLIGSGASIEEMTITGSALKATGKIQAEYDSASDWTGNLLRYSGRNIDIMSEHFYCSVDQRFDVTAGKYVSANEPLVDWTRRPANRVRSKVENYAEYRKRIPGSERIPVYIDEWAYFTNWVHPTPTLGVTIGYARGLHEMFRNTDLIKMAGFTFGTSCLSFNDTAVIYNTSGLLFKLYQSQLGTIPVRIEGNAPQPNPSWPGQPLQNAGGDTYPLDMVAALTSDSKFLTVAIVNPTEEDREVFVQLEGVKASSEVVAYTISGASEKARNIVGQVPEVKTTESRCKAPGNVRVGKASINIYRYTIID